jgi:hypothetical protein
MSSIQTFLSTLCLQKIHLNPLPMDGPS